MIVGHANNGNNFMSPNLTMLGKIKSVASIF